MKLLSQTLLLLLATQAFAELKLPNIFGSQMVLQRDKPARIWGWADSEKEVVVLFAGQEKSITAGKDGKWEISLDPMPANSKGQSLKVISGDTSITYDDVLLGDVWICGGQSNMEWRLRSSRDADIEIPSARYPAIRFIRIEPAGLPEPQDNFPAENGAGVWSPCSPETIGDCSGVAYFFAQRLHRRLDVPIGLVNAAWGGTMAQHWVTRGTLETLPSMKSYLKEYEDKCQTWIDGGAEDGAAKRLAEDLKKWEALAKATEAKGEKKPGGKPNPRSYQNPAQGRIPSGALNAMIIPLEGLTVRGTLFYQGENNSFGNTWIPFQETFPSVISDWRKIFRNEDMPFGIIQIAGWRTRRSMTYDMNHHTNVIREQQFLTWQNTPNTGLIVSFDANSDSNIHPRRKYPVGDRSARWALSTVYDIKDGTRPQDPLEWHGPIYQSMKIQKNKILISFEDEGSSGLRLDQTDARGFYIAGKDQVFHHAEARVVKPATVEIWSDDVPNPVAVRYAWSNLPLGTLLNGRELPAYPFRTDTWPLKPHYGEDLYHVTPASTDSE